MKIDMIYNGQSLAWTGYGSFKATSGLPGYQTPLLSCLKDAGPIPPGYYSLKLDEDSSPAQDIGNCTLKPSQKIQRIPRGADAGDCEKYWANWGTNRVGMVAADATTAKRCSPRRSGFYIHDSTKGYSHGCIEVEPRFFSVLRALVKTRLEHQRGRVERLLLQVSYSPGPSTNGGTKS
jgi:hypothetical protein